ncbi:hypothetical protein [Conexibacter sp. DBS9H8]|uniref:hypothetical protein n=1 Tax=Conexibacter sp. DBS9H8 TaxID=2937801 RepID=UPI00200D00E4|nr:hypothetical protein [Conexibacter sp. DBS9H8]
MKRDLTMLAGALTAAAGLAVPASARAAVTIGPLAPCYQAVPPHGVTAIHVRLSGGGASDNFVLDATIPGQGLGSAGSTDGTFGATGAADTTLTDVYPPGNPIGPIPGRRVNLSVQDFGPNGTVTTELGSVLLTTLALKVASTPTRPYQARQVAVSGVALADKRIYGFVTNRRGTRVLRRVYLGRGNVCGYVSHRAIVAPAHKAAGTYRFYVNAGPRLNRRDSLSEAFQITVF